VHPSIEAFAEFIHQYIAARRIKPLVAGLSMGGYVLLALLRAHPEDAAGAIFIDTRAEADSPEARANRLKSIEDIRAHGTGNAIGALMPRLLAPEAAPAVRSAVREIMSRQPPAACIAALAAMANRRDQTDFLPRIAVPSLVIVGDRDVITPPPAARTIQSGIPGARLVEIPGAGHMSPMEAPDAVNAALHAFAKAH
jgi:pimeloyl-ACP methyl ester carboxylesterase